MRQDIRQRYIGGCFDMDRRSAYTTTVARSDGLHGVADSGVRPHPPVFVIGSCAALLDMQVLSDPPSNSKRDVIVLSTLDSTNNTDTASAAKESGLFEEREGNAVTPSEYVITRTITGYDLNACCRYTLTQTTMKC